MRTFKEITPKELQGNVFEEIGKKWMLVGAQHNGKVNMMTASWGGLGIMWNKPVAYVFIRPQRYTKELVDAEETFSLSFFTEEYREFLTLCGKNSGRDMDKVKACGFHVESMSGAPVFQEAEKVLLCRKLYCQPMTGESFVAKDLDALHYPGKDYHYLYVGVIEKILVKE